MKCRRIFVCVNICSSLDVSMAHEFFRIIEWDHFLL